MLSNKIDFISDFIEKVYYITLNKETPYLVIENDEDVENIYYYYGNSFHSVDILRTERGTHYLDFTNLSQKYHGEQLAIKVRFKKGKKDLKYRLVSDVKNYQNPFKPIENFFSGLLKNALFFFFIGVVIILALVFVFVFSKKMLVKGAEKTAKALLSEEISQLEPIPLPEREDEIIPLRKIKDITKNYLVEKIRDYDKDDVVEFRTKEIYNKKGVRHLIRLAYLNSEDKFVAVSLLHPFSCQKVKNTIDYYGIKEIIKQVNKERIKKGKHPLIVMQEGFKI